MSSKRLCDFVASSPSEAPKKLRSVSCAYSSICTEARTHKESIGRSAAAASVAYESKPQSAATVRGNRLGDIVANFDDGKPCSFQKLGEDAHCHILSYLLCLPPPPRKPEKNKSAIFHFRAERHGSNDNAKRKQRPSQIFEEFFKLSEEEGGRYISIAAHDKERYSREMAEYETRLSRMFSYPRQLADLCRMLLTVSKHWRRVVGKLMNLKAPKDVLHPTELANIKARVGWLNLSTARRNFLLLCDERWAYKRFLPSDLYHDHHQPDVEPKCPLEYIVRHYADGSFDRFARLAENEYRKFLVIRCVEVVAYTRENEMYWATPSMPGQIIHVFWQAHMSSPRRYHHDCMSVLGDVIDCGHPSYQSVPPKSVAQYLSKRRTLFSFEHQLSSEYFSTGRRPAIYYIEDLVEVASMLRDEEAIKAHHEHETDLEEQSDDDD